VVIGLNKVVAIQTLHQMTRIHSLKTRTMQRDNLRPESHIKGRLEIALILSLHSVSKQQSNSSGKRVRLGNLPRTGAAAERNQGETRARHEQTPKSNCKENA
jgi:hypothetical protein